MDLPTLLCYAMLSLNSQHQYDDRRLTLACNLMEEVVGVAEENGLRPELIVALIHYESAWRPRVVSHAGACGLMQLIPKYTGKNSGVPKLSCQDLKDPHTNLKYGAKVLRMWINAYGKGSLKKGLCGYNAGYRCKGTSSYAKKIIKLSSKIRQEAVRIKEYDAILYNDPKP